MNEEKYKSYLVELVSLIKKQARKMKLDADHSIGEDLDYRIGSLMSYLTVIELMKNQTLAFNIKQKDIGLSDIVPERDLLFLKKEQTDLGLAALNYEEDDWTTEDITEEDLTEEKVKGYLWDTIKLMEERAVEAKNDADSTAYSQGEGAVYHSVFSLLKGQAYYFDINQEEIGLADIVPDQFL